GRVGKACGEICPDQAPAQFTTLGAQNAVLVVVTPLAWPFDRCTPVTRSPEETSTPRFLAAFNAAAVNARGSTLRSFKKNAGRFGSASAGSNSAKGAGSKLATVK